MAKPKAPTQDRPNPRNVVRRCPICDRGHTCFRSSVADLAEMPDEQPAQSSVVNNTYARVTHQAIGSWHGVKRQIPAGTRLRVVKTMTNDSGQLRAMVELADGDSLWMPGELLQPA